MRTTNARHRAVGSCHHHHLCHSLRRRRCRHRHRCAALRLHRCSPHSLTSARRGRMATETPTATHNAQQTCPPPETAAIHSRHRRCRRRRCCRRCRRRRCCRRRCPPLLDQVGRAWTMWARGGLILRGRSTSRVGCSTGGGMHAHRNRPTGTKDRRERSRIAPGHSRWMRIGAGERRETRKSQGEPGDSEAKCCTGIVAGGSGVAAAWQRRGSAHLRNRAGAEGVGTDEMQPV